MKRLFTLVLCLGAVVSNAQGFSELISFDYGDTMYHHFLTIDTQNYHHNIWQIGKPQKTFFNSAYSLPYAIVTDTVSPYPVNDTSVFYLKLPVTNIYPKYELHFLYQLDIDTNAIAKIERSIDTGHTWTNILDSFLTDIDWLIKPRLDTCTVGWKEAKLIGDWTSDPDTIIFRFTFISDSVFANRDGWIIDSVFLRDFWWEGIMPKLQKPSLISIYPNPSRGNLYIHPNEITADAYLIIYDLNGKEVYRQEQMQGAVYINLQLSPGVYILRYFTGRECYEKRLLIGP